MYKKRVKEMQDQIQNRDKYINQLNQKISVYEYKLNKLQRTFQNEDGLDEEFNEEEKMIEGITNKQNVVKSILKKENRGNR